MAIFGTVIKPGNKGAAERQFERDQDEKLTLLLNSREMRALSVYCTRYRIENKAGFLRETIMKEIVRRFNDEHPTLWEENEPDLFNQGLK
jgi:hypothetical protein